MHPEGFNSIERFLSDQGGVLLIDKPADMSSFDVIRFLRRILGVRKIGHAGTLDPMATGLLIVASRRETRSLGQFQSLPKTYEGEMVLGETTASDDAQTPVTRKRAVEGIGESEVYATSREFLGVIRQVPPMYSAVKRDGVRLYRLARRGVEIEREPRQVEIHALDILRVEMPVVSFRVVCSKGTYVRSLARDIGERLGCGAHLRCLRRTAIGGYSVGDAWTLPVLERRRRMSGAEA
ncbi:MAG: tRNA pseudouridine(55) synthase TruB [Bacteroidota bacterium]|nr:tRNA pseudouridine(55) synthase TruB [Bacteroidota bacterium]